MTARRGRTSNDCHHIQKLPRGKFIDKKQEVEGPGK